MYGLLKNVCVVPVGPVRVWITGVYSPYVVSLCDFAYYVFG